MGDWANLKDYVFYLFRTNQIQSKEFQALLKVYGRERLKEMWKEFCERKIPMRDPGDDDETVPPV